MLRYIDSESVWREFLCGSYPSYALMQQDELLIIQEAQASKLELQ